MNAELKDYLLFALAMVWITCCAVAAFALGPRLPEWGKVGIVISFALTGIWVGAKSWHDFAE